MIAPYKNPKDIKLHILWLTDKRINKEYKSFVTLSNNFQKCKSQIYISIPIIINKIQKIEFKNTYIIITEKVFEQFISEFVKKIIEIKVIPKFVIYEREKNPLNNKNNNSYYNYGGIHSSLEEIFDFIKKDLIINNNDISSFNDTLGLKSKLYMDKEEQDIKLILDPIESLNQMYLPTYFKIMIKINKEEEKSIVKFTRKIYEEYKNNQQIEYLLSQIVNLNDIPKELLCKYWARLYTAKGFHYEINEALNNKKTGKYIIFIKMMYDV